MKACDFLRYFINRRFWLALCLTIALVSHAEGQVPTSGLSGYWSFDEGSGTTVFDSSGNGNTGTLINGPTWTTGQVGGALNFDGANDHVFIPPSTSINSIANSLTLSLWINVDAYSSFPRHLSGPGFKYEQDASGTIGITLRNAGGEIGEVFSVTGEPAGTWQHLVATWDGTILRTYKNGVEIANLATFGSTIGIGATFIGTANGAFSSFFDGKIDEVRIYNRELSPTEVQDLYNVESGPDTTAPIISNSSPSGTLAFGTTQTTLSLTTNEIADCRYSTTAGTPYSSISNTFSTSSGTSHSTTVSGLQNGQAYDYYIRCQDTAGNENTTDFTISFSVSSIPDTTPPNISSV
jgi:hypothetical protein